MKLWEEYILRITRSEVLDELVRFYDTQKIPIEIRHHCCTLIEDQLDPMTPGDFVRSLEIGFRTLPNFNRRRLSWLETLLVTEYKNDPDRLLNKIDMCLKKELELIKMDTGNYGNPPSEEVEIVGTQQQPTVRRYNYHDAVQRIMSFKRAIEAFQSRLQTKRGDFEQLFFLRTKPENLFSPDEHAKKLYLEHSTAECGAPRYQLFSKLYYLVEEFDKNNFLESLGHDLEIWEYELKRSYIGFPEPKYLQDIKNCAADLYSILRDVKIALRHLEDMQNLNLVHVYSSTELLHAKLRNLQKRLLQITCRFEPTKSMLRFDSHKPILHYGTKFPLKVSTCFPPTDNSIKVLEVAVQIFTEDEAANFAKKEFDPKKPPKTNAVVGILSNNVYPIKADPPTCPGRKVPAARRIEHNIPIVPGPNLTVEFPHFELARSRNTSRRTGPELVTDRRYYLFVHFTLELDEEECHIWRISSPIAIGSNRSQDCACWGNLLWSYGLSRLGEPINSGVMSMNANWNDILELLNAFHMKVTRQPLGEKQRKHLTSRAKKRKGQQIQTYSEMCKDVMDGNAFTFWGWFYNSLSLIKFLPITTEYVHGFISKSDAANLLSKKEPLTFVFRYSDSVSGGISIVCKSLLGNDIEHTIPKTNSDLDRDSIEAIVQNSKDYRFLYPNIPKAEMKFQTKPKQNIVCSYYTGLKKFYELDRIFPLIDSSMACGSGPYETPQESPINIAFEDFRNATTDTGLLPAPNSEPEDETVYVRRCTCTLNDYENELLDDLLAAFNTLNDK